MDPLLTFFILWVGLCAALAGLIAAGMNYDRIAVFFLGLVNAPVYIEARRLAGAIYRHPEQWTDSLFELAHPQIGKICGGAVVTLDVQGPGFGRWRPTALERRIIWDACQWYRRVYIRSLVAKAMA